MPVLMLCRNRSLGATSCDSEPGTVIAATSVIDIQKRMNSGSPESPCVNAVLRSQDLGSLFGLITCGRGSLGKRAKRVFFERAPKGCCNLGQQPACRPCREWCPCNSCACAHKRWMEIAKKMSNFLQTQRETLLAWDLQPKKEFRAAVCWSAQTPEKCCRGLFTVAAASLFELAMWMAPLTLQLRPVGEQQRMFPRLRQHQRQGSAR